MITSEKATMYLYFPCCPSCTTDKYTINPESSQHDLVCCNGCGAIYRRRHKPLPALNKQRIVQDQATIEYAMDELWNSLNDNLKR